jgi:hypothetical protein
VPKPEPKEAEGHAGEQAEGRAGEPTGGELLWSEWEEGRRTTENNRIEFQAYSPSAPQRDFQITCRLFFSLLTYVYTNLCHCIHVYHQIAQQKLETTVDCSSDNSVVAIFSFFLSKQSR